MTGRLVIVGSRIAAAGLLLALVVAELRGAHMQAALFGGIGRDARYNLGDGQSAEIRFPAGGPHDQRLGYRDLPQWIHRLQSAGYEVRSQARLSPTLIALHEAGLPLPYHEKLQAGLTLRDCRGESLSERRLPQRIYAGFDDVPPLVLQSLLFVEDRQLLDPEAPNRNPALDPPRLGKALLEQLQRVALPDRSAAGGSTLATQIEKYRHSPGGRTGSASEKLRQMLAASLRGYLDGPDTLARRRQIALEWINSVPLGARAGFGEVHGIGDGLWAWYGRDSAEVDRLLLGHRPSGIDAGAWQAARALAFKQVLSLVIAQRRPMHYLQDEGQVLEGQANSYVRLMAEAGYVEPALRDAALRQPLRLQPRAPALPRPDFAERKAAMTLRTQLAGLLGLPEAYALERLDLDVDSTLDGRAQRLVTQALAALKDPAAARAAGLVGEHLLGEHDDPSRLVFGVTLIERADDGSHHLRVQADNVDQPFDVNQGLRLDLGSTAKLRTLISYLEAIAGLHAQWAWRPADELQAWSPSSRDPLALWTREYLLAQRGAAPLQPMLDAALERHYSANPGETFFTGGGAHRFENFDGEKHDHRVMSVREAFHHSVNLVFIRLMRDVVRHQVHRGGNEVDQLFNDPADARRQALLARFADHEGSVYLARFYRAHRAHRGSAQSPADAASAPDDAAPTPRVHPLKAWLDDYLRQHPDAGLTEVLAASAAERQQAYAWLFRTRHSRAQDQRIATILERDAFGHILRDWQRLGYPFDTLTPSYASSIGAAGDRPAALAHLMGLLLDAGDHRPPLQTLPVLHFGRGTPYETRLERHPAAGRAVLSPQVAAAARSALLGVVESGTARRLKGALLDGTGQPLVVAGKTGTGDHRSQRFSAGGQLLGERVIERSATFAFTLGERYHGTVLVYVQGPEAARYRFTSALPVQLLKSLGPQLMPLLHQQACPAEPPPLPAPVQGRGLVMAGAPSQGLRATPVLMPLAAPRAGLKLGALPIPIQLMKPTSALEK
ncbi:transglycosylase domain-containing protein [Pseudaquabacterium terrae]|uniref:transglycosylase domain-containing protein n=1 Tax=Pseudaquabacterium terrae TaxID=2732868 RepID=UPI001FED151F|nr:transglycosylase domain-containing protein [Aquabacterium terrae]